MTARTASRLALRDGGALRPAASWPAVDPAEPIALAGDDLPDLGSHGSGFPVRHQGHHPDGRRQARRSPA